MITAGPDDGVADVQLVTLDDRRGDRRVRRRVVDGPGTGRTDRLGRLEGFERRGRLDDRGHPNRPAHRLDGQPVDGPSEEPPVARGEAVEECLGRCRTEVARRHGHRDLPALAPVPHRHLAFGRGAGVGALPDEGLGLGFELLQDGSGPVDVEVVRGRVEAPHRLVRERRQEEPDGRIRRRPPLARTAPSGRACPSGGWRAAEPHRRTRSSRTRPRSLPFSTACTRAALVMFSSTTSAMPTAAVVDVESERITDRALEGGFGARAERG